MTAADKLALAAQAVIERWDSPKWSDPTHTGEYINALRQALAAFRAAPGAEPVIIVSIDEHDAVQDWRESRLPAGTHRLYASPQAEPQALQFESAAEARKDREHAEAYFRQAEDMLTGNEKVLWAEIESLKDHLRLCNELKREYQEQVAAALSRPDSRVIADALATAAVPDSRVMPEPLSDRERELFAAGYEAAQQDAQRCDIPPLGWVCTRKAGHEGPCAAVEDKGIAECVQRGMDRLRGIGAKTGGA